MERRKPKKTAPWRIVVGVISLAFIAYLWIDKDVASLYASMPEEQAVPLMVTTIAVSLAKVAALTCGILLIKWIIRKGKKSENG